MTGADNQQERLSVASFPSNLGNFLAGFALGEASFMIVCRPRGDYTRGWEDLGGFQRVADRSAARKPMTSSFFRRSGGAARQRGHDGSGLQTGPAPARADEPWWQAPLHGRENPQRLYAELTNVI